jgi:shikimate 5-dehydrogenase
MSYKPRQTPLLTVAQRHQGWGTVSGVEVLLTRAFDLLLLWTGLEAPKDVMMEAILALDREGAAKAKVGML